MNGTAAVRVASAALIRRNVAARVGCGARCSMGAMRPASDSPSVAVRNQRRRIPSLPLAIHGSSTRCMASASWVGSCGRTTQSSIVSVRPQPTQSNRAGSRWPDASVP